MLYSLMLFQLWLLRYIHSNIIIIIINILYYKIAKNQRKYSGIGFFAGRILL